MLNYYQRIIRQNMWTSVPLGRVVPENLMMKYRWSKDMKVGELKTYLRAVEPRHYPTRQLVSLWSSTGGQMSSSLTFISTGYPLGVCWWPFCNHNRLSRGNSFLVYFGCCTTTTVMYRGWPMLSEIVAFDMFVVSMSWRALNFNSTFWLRCWKCI